MTNNTPKLTHGDEYIVFYEGGPYDGQNDIRISTDGSWDTEVTVIADTDGNVDAQQVYTVVSARELNDKVQVTYRWDAKDGDGYQAPEERGEL
ncbi:MAG: oligoribonuclease [Glaciihabitans sp.]|nr:oligoribonuclease [Glaciihabitans sp.]